MSRIPLEQGKYYHVYNRGNNSSDLFYEKDNYLHFLRLYKKYMEAVVDTFVWVLLKNNFHLLIYIKEQNEIETEKLSYSTIDKPKIVSASKQFLHMFNAYTQSINERHKRTGSLFEKKFRRKEVTSEKYFQNLIYYNKPVKHGFADSMNVYPWSSYETIISKRKTKLQRKRVIEMFDNLNNFKYYHSRKQNLNNIDDLLIE